MNARRLNALVALGALLLLARPVTAQLTPKDEAALRALSASALASLSSGDVATYVGLFSEDVVLQPPNAPTVHGRQGLEAWARAFPTVTRLTWPQQRFQGDGTVAYATSAYVLEMEGSPPDRGKQLAVFRRSAGGAWQISAVSFNSDLPPLEAPAGHEAAVATLFSVWNTKEYARLDAALAQDFRREGADGDAASLAGMKEFMRQVHTAYPDFHIQMNASAYEGDLGLTHWTITGTHSGAGSVPATGRSVEISGMTLYRFQNGMMTEQRTYYDTATLQAQLGVQAIPHAR